MGHEGYKAYVRNLHIVHPVTQGAALIKARDARDEVSGGPSRLEPGHVAAIDDYRSVMAQRAIFQGLASMGLPAFTIHSIVKYSGRALKDAKNTRIRTYGPIGVGRSIKTLHLMMVTDPGFPAWFGRGTLPAFHFRQAGRNCCRMVFL